MKPIFPSLIAASATVRLLAKKARVVGMLILAVGFLATPMLMPSAGNAQDAESCEIDGGFERPDGEIGSAKD